MNIIKHTNLVPGADGNALSAGTAAGDTEILLSVPGIAGVVDALGRFTARVVEHKLLVAAAGNDMRLRPSQCVDRNGMREDTTGRFSRAVLRDVVADNAAVSVTRQEARSSCAEMFVFFYF